MLCVDLYYLNVLILQLMICLFVFDTPADDMFICV
jgi:hypothetical protein